MRSATPAETAKWDELVAANPDGGNVLQVAAFAETKQRHGWNPHYLIGELAAGEVAVLALSRRTALGELWYVPKGPGVADFDQFQKLLPQLAAAATGALLVKVEPELLREDVKADQLSRLGLIKAHDLQLNVDTVVVDLAPEEEEIIASFKQKTRYNIRLAERKGVLIEPVPTDRDSIQQMYKLMQATKERAGFYLRSIDYFADFWHLHAAGGTGQMFFARYEGQVLAGVFATFLGKKGLYKDGGSTREHSDLQAAYLLQWEVMRWLKARGVTEYDLHGTPPAAEIDNPDHRFAGLARFKTGFNPYITEYVGLWDLPLASARYRVWTKLGERLVQAYNVKVKHELFY